MGRRRVRKAERRATESARLKAGAWGIALRQSVTPGDFRVPGSKCFVYTATRWPRKETTSERGQSDSI